jgi:putative proteasome-type protease
MTYCVGLLVKEGLVLISDTRTNAGIDNIASFRKLHLFQAPDRMLAIASSGNLSLTQAVISLLSEGFAHPESGETETLAKATSMFHAAQMVGRAVREVYRIDGPSLEQHDTRFEISLLLGGQIKDRRLRLFMVYSAGNFIEATSDTPFLQIGEHKYGKPVLDRAVKYETEIYDALKIGLISMDSTMRSNLAVGLPIDLLVLRRDTLVPDLSYRITSEDHYFSDLRHRWSEALREAHLAIPQPPYKR